MQTAICTQVSSSPLIDVCPADKLPLSGEARICEQCSQPFQITQFQKSQKYCKQCAHLRRRAQDAARKRDLRRNQDYRAKNYAYTKKWVRRNRERYREYQRQYQKQWMEANREQRKKYDREWRRNKRRNDPLFRAREIENAKRSCSKKPLTDNQKRFRELQEMHPDEKKVYTANRKLRYNRQWEKLHPDKKKAQRHRHYFRHKDKYFIKAHRRRALVRATTADESANVAILKLRSKRKFRCYWCGDIFGRKKLNIDHIIPLSREGLHSASNLCASCEACNKSKNDRMPNEYQHQLLLI